MTRLRRILIAAAVLVGLGTGLPLALKQANEADAEPFTCNDFGKVLRRLAATERVDFFVAVEQGFAPPAAGSTKIAGDCSGGVCTVKPQGCAKAFRYEYKKSQAVAGWSLFYVRDVPVYFAGAWKQIASENSEMRFYEGFKEVSTACTANFTNGQCVSLISGVNECWKLASGNLCRDGLEYGPGLGGSTATAGDDVAPGEARTETPAVCSPGAGSTPFPCEVTFGTKPETVHTRDFPASLELNE